MLPADSGIKFAGRHFRKFSQRRFSTKLSDVRHVVRGDVVQRVVTENVAMLLRQLPPDVDIDVAVVVIIAANSVPLLPAEVQQHAASSGLRRNRVSASPELHGVGRSVDLEPAPGRFLAPQVLVVTPEPGGPGPVRP